VKANDLVRVRPLPAGRYWVTINDVDFEAFTEWKDSTKLIRLEAVEPHTDPRFDFYVFRIKEPGGVVWPDQFGHPSVAAEGVTSFDQVVRAPDIEEPDIKDLAQQLITVGKWTLVGAGLYALVKIFGRK